MNNYPSHAEGQFTVNCYKCTAGCIHLEYSNIMFTFTPEQFLAFAEIIGETRRRLLLERQVEASDPFAGIEAFVM